MELELGCPTVAQEVATELIERLEKEGTEMQRRLKALRAGEPGEVNSKVWRWMVDIKELWPSEDCAFRPMGMCGSALE